MELFATPARKITLSAVRALFEFEVTDGGVFLTKLNKIYKIVSFFLKSCMTRKKYYSEREYP
jgi:hypothetical protein